MQCALPEQSYLKGIVVSTSPVLIDHRLVLSFIWLPPLLTKFSGSFVMGADSSLPWGKGEKPGSRTAFPGLRPLSSLKCMWYLYYYLFTFFIISFLYSELFVVIIIPNRRTPRRVLRTSPLVADPCKKHFCQNGTCLVCSHTKLCCQCQFANKTRQTCLCLLKPRTMLLI